MRLPGTRSGSATAAPDPGDAAAGGPDPELVAQRDRLTERFALMQSELGGLFYEMAIRDHVNLEILAGKAAALQRVDAELAQVEYLLAQKGEGAIGGQCPNCGSDYVRGAAFCSQCAAPLLAT